jgi:hypothetical protein
VGDFRDIRWTWDSADTDVRNGCLAMDGRVSVADLIAFMADVAPGVDLEDVQVNCATVRWSRRATQDELEDRRRVMAAHAARHEQWERETLVRLIEKYGGGSRGK